MLCKNIKLNLPNNILKQWQEIVDILAEIVDIPAALIMKVEEPEIKVLISSNSDGNWHPIQEFLIRYPKADFSHGICPECMKKLYPEYAE